MKVYIAGPMRGYEEFNFPAFFTAEIFLRAIDHQTINPARMDIEIDGLNTAGWTGNEDLGEDFKRKVLARDMKAICEEADAIFMLRGWEHSSGARAEHALANALGLEVMYAPA